MVPIIEDITVKDFLSGIWEERIVKGIRSPSIENAVEEVKDKIIERYGNRILTKEIVQEISEDIIFIYASSSSKNYKMANNVKINEDKITFSENSAQRYVNNIKAELRKATSAEEIPLKEELKITKNNLLKTYILKEMAYTL